jgi:hypothetical protein
VVGERTVGGRHGRPLLHPACDGGMDP